MSQALPSTDSSGKGKLRNATGQGARPAGRTRPDIRARKAVSSCGCRRPLSGRNLVVCIDGTANQFSKNNTNVVELFSRLVKNNEQLAYYNSGIGTYVQDSDSWLSYDSWKQFFDHTIDMAIATNFKSKVLGAYQWLSENYQDGDRIFLFGFSRGAYQVRVIAGMIEKVGLVLKGCNEQIPFAYELYTKTTATEQRLVPREPDQICERFKYTVSRPYVKVHFVGAWDTVSSIGVLRGTSLPETTTGMKHVCAFRHALALDELRVKFLPEYVNGGEGPEAAQSGGDVKEVWFAGSHSDIGGGNVPNLLLDHFGPSLRWMSYEAIEYGLRLEPNRNKWSPLSPSPSMTMVWRILEYTLPIRHLSYEDANSTVWSRHCQKPRRMKNGQLIHESVFEEIGRKGSTYIPTALLLGSATWGQNKDQAKNLGMLEEDPYANATNVLEKLKGYNRSDRLTEADIHVLESLAQGGAVDAQSITDVPDAANLLIGALDEEMRDLDLQQASEEAIQSSGLQRKTIAAFISALDAFLSAPGYVISYTPAMLEKLWSILELQHPDRRKSFAKFRTIFTEEYFRLCIPPDDPFRELFNRVCGISEYRSHFSLDNIVLVTSPELAHLEAHTKQQTKDVIFDVVDKRVTKYGASSLPIVDTSESDLTFIARLLGGAGHFYRALNRWGRSEAADQITFEFYQLIEDDDDDDLDSFRTVGPSLCQEGVINIQTDDEGLPFGVTIINHSEHDFHVYLFYFDCDDLSITSFFVPVNNDSDIEANLLRSRDRLLIGHGDSEAFPFAFDVPESQDISTGFFKLIISAQALDLSYIPQSSPFEMSRRSIEFRGNAERSEYGAVKSILIPVIQRAGNST